MVALAIAVGGHAEEFTHDFRRGVAGIPALQLIGPNAQHVIKPDDQGIRLILTEKRKKRDPVGVATKFCLRGDFEITASYELLKADVPVKGYGTGARLWMKLDAASVDVISLGRVVRPKNGDVFVAYRVSKGSNGKQLTQTRSSPAHSKKGKLRLARRGPTLAFLISDGENAEFVELYHLEVGTKDIEQVQLTATTGGEPVTVDLRFANISIRAHKLPTEPATASRTWWLWWVACAIGVTILGTAGVLIWKRARTRQSSKVSHSPTDVPEREKEYPRSSVPPKRASTSKPGVEE